MPAPRASSNKDPNSCRWPPRFAAAWLRLKKYRRRALPCAEHHDSGPLSSQRKAPRATDEERRKPACGRIAQLVEQLTLNQRVLGSSPSASTKKSNEINALEGRKSGRYGPFFKVCSKLCSSLAVMRSSRVFRNVPASDASLTPLRSIIGNANPIRARHCPPDAFRC